MINISIINHTQTQRPFRRYRPDLLNAKKWGFFFSDSWHGIQATVEKTKLFANSFLGKILIYTGAELIGSALGKTVGRHIIRDLASRIGGHLVPFTLISSTLIAAKIAIASKTSRTLKIFFAASLGTSLTLLATTPSSFSYNFGATLGFSVGEIIGNLAGTILGGYGGLVLAKSNVLIFDKKNPWDCYSINMVRFISAGALFDLCIVTPTTPYIGSLFMLPRTLIRSLIQTLAYSSNTFLPFAKECIRAQCVTKKILTPFFVELITNRFNSSDKKSPIATKKMTQKIFSTLTHLPSIIEKGVIIGLDNGLELLFSNGNASLFITVALRSLHEYVNLLKNTHSIKIAQSKFEKSSMTSAKLAQHHKEELIKALGVAIKIDSGFSRKFLSIMMKSFFREYEFQKLSINMISKIQELEIEIIGISLLKKHQELFLKQLIDVYLQHYLIFILSNWNRFTRELTPSEEQLVIVDLNNAVISSYLTYVTPPIIASTLRQINNNIFQLFFKMKSSLNFLLQQPDHIAFFNTQENNLHETYFQTPAKEALFEDYMLISSAKQSHLESFLLKQYISSEKLDSKLNENHFAL